MRPSAQCSSNKFSDRYTRVLNATAAEVSTATFPEYDSECAQEALSAATVGDMECVERGWRHTSAQSCNVSTLAFAQWAGWPTSNGGLGGCPADIGAAHPAAAASALLAALLAALASGLAQ